MRAKPGYISSRQDLLIDSDIPTFAFQKHDILKVPLVRRLENINISSKLANSLVPVELRPGLAVATVSGREQQLLSIWGKFLWFLG